MNKEFCTKCGQELKEDSAFCTSCGTTLKSANSPNKVPLKSDTNKNLLFGFIGLIVIVVFAFIIGNGKESADNSVKAENSQVIRVKAEEMIDDYIRDQVGAEQKYKDKRVIVTGKVIMKEQFKNSYNYGILIANKEVGSKLYYVMISVDNQTVDTINKIKIDDFVNVEGICVGIVKQSNPLYISIQIENPKINQ